jgi:hypothetical protein
MTFHSVPRDGVHSQAPGLGVGLPPVGPICGAFVCVLDSWMPSVRLGMGAPRLPAARPPLAMIAEASGATEENQPESPASMWAWVREPAHHGEQQWTGECAWNHIPTLAPCVKVGVSERC